MGALVAIIVIVVVLVVGGIIISYFVSRSEEGSGHYRAEKAYEAKVKKGIRQDHLKKAKKHKLK